MCINKFYDYIKQVQNFKKPNNNTSTSIIKTTQQKKIDYTSECFPTMHSQDIVYNENQMVGRQALGLESSPMRGCTFARLQW